MDRATLERHADAYAGAIHSFRHYMRVEGEGLKDSGIPEDDVAEAMAHIEAGIEEGLETLRHTALKRAEAA